MRRLVLLYTLCLEIATLSWFNKTPQHKSALVSMNELKTSFYNPYQVKHRRRTTKEQFNILEKNFIINNKPSAETRREIAQTLSMTPREVQVWFQNRRAKEKNIQNKEGFRKTFLDHPNQNSLDLELAKGSINRNIVNAKVYDGGFDGTDVAPVQVENYESSIGADHKITPNNVFMSQISTGEELMYSGDDRFYGFPQRLRPGLPLKYPNGDKRSFNKPADHCPVNGPDANPRYGGLRNENGFYHPQGGLYHIPNNSFQDHNQLNNLPMLEYNLAGLNFRNDYYNNEGFTESESVMAHGNRMNTYRYNLHNENQPDSIYANQRNALAQRISLPPMSRPHNRANRNFYNVSDVDPSLMESYQRPMNFDQNLVSVNEGFVNQFYDKTAGDGYDTQRSMVIANSTSERDLSFRSSAPPVKDTKNNLESASSSFLKKGITVDPKNDSSNPSGEIGKSKTQAQYYYGKPTENANQVFLDPTKNIAENELSKPNLNQPSNPQRFPIYETNNYYTVGNSLQGNDLSAEQTKYNPQQSDNSFFNINKYESQQTLTSPNAQQQNMQTPQALYFFPNDCYNTLQQ